MSTLEAIVGWNAAFNRDPAEQLAHIQKIEEKLRGLGAASVLFCLNELTSNLTGSSSVPSLQTALEANGYAVNSRTTTLFRKSNRYEGVGFASQDLPLRGPIRKTVFMPTHTRNAHRHKANNAAFGPLHREHTRHLASLSTPDKTVHTTHASYYAPPAVERRKILEYAAHGEADRLLIGDFNTALNQQFITEAEAAGWVKLADPKRRVTFPLRFGPLPLRGLELDHALASPTLAAKSHLEIGERGPSDHHPLVVIIEN